MTISILPNPCCPLKLTPMLYLECISSPAGELEASEGTVTKHPNLRVAYVAQHAFHHIEKHLDKTPNEYIQWRYAGGEDREEQEKVSRQVRGLPPGGQRAAALTGPVPLRLWPLCAAAYVYVTRLRGFN